MIKLLALLATLSLSQTAYSAAPAAATPPPASAPATPAPPLQEEEKETVLPHSEAGSYQQVIEEYKAYVATVDKGVRDEIVEFRKEMAKLNKQKHTTYKKLSQEAQHYLAKERELKRKLPIEQRKSLKDNASEATTE